MRRAFLPVACLLIAALALLLWTLYDAPGDPGKRVTLATTTSTDNSGLLGYLLKPWSKETGIDVKVIAVGTGKALALAKRGDADLLLVHARKREDAFVAEGYGIDRRDVMWNDFVIVGPAADPAGVRGMQDAAQALAAIAKAGAPFVSRGDDSGTHIRELAVWKRAGVDPEGQDFYHKAGQGMGPCLTMASQRNAYILTDRGTYLAVRAGKALPVLVEGDAALRNPYGAILVNPAKHPHVQVEAARRLLDFLTSPEGQARIGAFRKNDQVLFHPHRSGS
jgi:tungstate transport system substrate-binding protein